MSQYTEGQFKTFKAGANLSAKQYFIVKPDSTEGQVVLASAATDKILGTLDNKPLSGENAIVSMRHGGGTHKVKLGGTVNAVGLYLTADSAGKAVATTSAGNQVFGLSIETGVAEDVIEYMPVFWVYA